MQDKSNNNGTSNWKPTLRERYPYNTPLNRVHTRSSYTQATLLQSGRQMFDPLKDLFLENYSAYRSVVVTCYRRTGNYYRGAAIEPTLWNLFGLPFLLKFSPFAAERFYRLLCLLGATWAGSPAKRRLTVENLSSRFPLPTVWIFIWLLSRGSSTLHARSTRTRVISPIDATVDFNVPSHSYRGWLKRTGVLVTLVSCCKSIISTGIRVCSNSQLAFVQDCLIWSKLID